MYNVSVTKDVRFAEVAGEPLLLDIYRPDTVTDPPPVVFLHGGAWAVGDKSEAAESRLSALASAGVAVLSANYRLLPSHRYPAQVHDAKAAVRWTRAHGDEHGLASGRVGIWGASAGAYLATMVGLTAGDPDLEGDVGVDLTADSGVDAVVDWFGQSDLVANTRRSWLEKEILTPPVELPFLGVGAIDSAEEQETARAASPLARVTPDAPPFLIAHGDRDRVTPLSESTALHNALVRAGVDSTLVVLGGGGHEGAEFDAAAHLRMTAGFLLAHLA